MNEDSPTGKWRIPIAVAPGHRVILTQPYGPTSNPLEPKGPNDEPHFHYGLDLVCGDDHYTYGAPVVCPFPSGVITSEMVAGSIDGEGSYLFCAHTDANGIERKILCYHLSEAQPVGMVAEGSVLGKIGNTGLVSPKPSLVDPYAGAHLHLEYYINGVRVDPLPHFDITNPFIGPVPSKADALPATNWLIGKLYDLLRPFDPNLPDNS